nr:uncharacterized protein LOC124818088 [Hydra vulgaris]
MTSPWSNHEEVGNALIEGFVLLYGETKESTLAKLRYNKYIDLPCKGIISPEKFPPTDNAAYFHGLRAHCQILLWPLINDIELDATEWGWKQHDRVITPIMNEKGNAPEALIQVIRCNCKVCFEINVFFQTP